ncbi:methyl-accepting chemotaxis protein [Clostridium sp. BJN0001]|uniref:methyl-accepting chemotaxis protein n=1 Tax=Clostridium sp. BJN0001 TaxID=2930219 RepID=UPI001FD624EB|nr:methyl-accepting chemotaxis protein [Clostridium sp. BJN0001]
MKTKSIKNKILMSVLPIVSIVCIILAAYAYIIVRKSLIEKSSDMLQEIARVASNEVDNAIEKDLAVIESASKDTNFINNGEITLEDLDELKNMVESKEFYNSGIVYEDGSIHYIDGSIIDIRDRDFFKEAMNGKSFVSKPFISRIDRRVIVAMSSPIEVNGNVVGAVVGLKSGSEYSTITNKINVLDAGSAFMVSSDGTLIASKDTDKVLDQYNLLDDQNLSKICTNMAQGQTGIETYVDENKNKQYVSYAPVSDKGWSLAVQIDENTLLSQVKKILIATVIIAVIGIALVIYFTYRITNKISKNIENIKSSLEVINSGDFTVELDENGLKDNTEIGSMNRAIEGTIDKMGVIFLNMKKNSTTINDESTNLASISEELLALTNNISEAIGEVAKGNTSQASDLTSITGELNEFSTSMNEMNSDIKKINVHVKDVGTKSQTSNKELNKIAQVLQELNQNFDRFINSLNNMNKDVNEVNKMTDFINQISEQTNLLALNAAIEAARAGDAGKGFAVVAEEIRKLAEASKESAGKINNVIKNVLDGTSEMVDKASIMQKGMNKQNDVINSSLKAFKDINKNIDIIVPKIESTVENFDNLDSKKNNIMEKIENVSSVSEEISATSEEIAASSEELTKAGDEVANSAMELTKATDSMNKKLSAFKVK